VRTVQQAAAVCFVLALMTGMRAGELCGLKPGDVMPDHLKIRSGKTGKRDVPLTPTAVRVLQMLDGWSGDTLLGIKAQTLDAFFRRARDKAGLVGFTFHDTRHTAATRLAQRLHVLDLCKVFGWKSTTRALTYFNPSAGDLAKRMAG
jgi:integrase